MELKKRRTLLATWAEMKEDVGEDRLSCILAAALASIMFILVYSRLRLYPFGDYTLIYADGDQYASYHGLLIDAIRSGEGVFYTFRAVLGDGLIPTIAYYSMSPFNLLLLLFPNNLIAGIHFIAYCKQVLTAVTFCILLNARRSGAIAEKAVFSVCYAFIGYLAFFSWNLSWMDGVLVLPLMCLGTLRLVSENKYGLFVFSIAYSILSNFYIGFMICIASVIIYLSALFMLSESKIRDSITHTIKEGFLLPLRDSFPRWLLSLLSGIGLSGILLVPAVAGLPKERHITLSDILAGMQLNFKPFDYISMFFTGRIDDQQMNHPMVFFGIIPLLMVVLFFFNRSVSRQKKGLAAALLFLFSFSFWNSSLNMLWHGMSYNYSFNYRYSFILSFLLLFLSFEMFTTLDRIKVPFIHTGVFLSAFCFFIYNETQAVFFAEDIFRDLFLLFGGLLLVYVYLHFQARRRLIVAALLLLIFFNAYRNTITIMWPDVRTSVTASTFLEEYAQTKAALNKIDDNSFFRVEKDFRTGRSDAPLYGYYGISNYASTENVPLLTSLREYGIGHRWMWGFHTFSTPLATDALFDMKYILSKESITHKGFTEYAYSDGIHIYRNESAFPLLMFSESLPAFLATDNSYDRMNRIFQAFEKTNSPSIYQAIKSTDRINGDLFCKSFTVMDEANKPIYLYLNQPAQAVYVYAQDSMRELIWSDQRFSYYIGSFPRGTEVRVYIHVPEKLQQQIQEQMQMQQSTVNNQIINTRDLWRDTLPIPSQSILSVAPDRLENVISGEPDLSVSAPLFDIGTCLLYSEDTKQIRETAASVQKKTTALFVKGRAASSDLNGAHVRAVITASKSGYVVTTIPYDECWRIDVDGIRVRPEYYMGQFLGIPVEAGEHTIEMYYTPSGFVAGALLTILSSLILVFRHLEHHVFCRKHAEESDRD